MLQCGSGQTARLIGLGLLQPATYLLDAGICTLGRSPLCQVVIPQPLVSRLHAKIEWTGQGYCLYDMGSANGTFVNGRRLPGPHLLTPGDWIGLGRANALLRFEDSGSFE
jgi:pSer/pThr/pTyr-binding forkhead associated (FHA) protein